jgi:hypothetical protein
MFYLRRVFRTRLLKNHLSPRPQPSAGPPRTGHPPPLEGAPLTEAARRPPFLEKRSFIHSKSASTSVHHPPPGGGGGAAAGRAPLAYPQSKQTLPARTKSFVRRFQRPAAPSRGASSAPQARRPREQEQAAALRLCAYGWIPHNAGFGFLDIAGAALGQIHF